MKYFTNMYRFQIDNALGWNSPNGHAWPAKHYEHTLMTIMFTIKVNFNNFNFIGKTILKNKVNINIS